MTGFVLAGSNGFSLSGPANGTNAFVPGTLPGSALVANSVPASALGSLTQQVMFSSALPFIVPGSGSVANNGVVTLTVGLPVAFASCYMYFAAGVLAATGAGSAAGFYYCTMSSITAVTAFNNVYAGPGQPTIPAAPTALVSTGPGAYTGPTTATLNAQSFTIGAATMGIRDALKITCMFSTVNNADTKTLATTIGGSAIGSFTSLASNLTFVAAATWQNRDSLASQVGCNTSSSSYGGAATALTYTAVNMANSQTLQFAFGHTTATDYVICESLLVELLKGE